MKLKKWVRVVLTLITNAKTVTKENEDVVATFNTTTTSKNEIRKAIYVGLNIVAMAEIILWINGQIVF